MSGAPSRGMRWPRVLAWVGILGVACGALLVHLRDRAPVAAPASTPAAGADIADWNARVALEYARNLGEPWAEGARSLSLRCDGDANEVRLVQLDGADSFVLVIAADNRGVTATTWDLPVAPDPPFRHLAGRSRSHAIDAAGWASVRGALVEPGFANLPVGNAPGPDVASLWIESCLHGRYDLTMRHGPAANADAHFIAAARTLLAAARVERELRTYERFATADDPR